MEQIREGITQVLEKINQRYQNMDISPKLCLDCGQEIGNDVDCRIQCCGKCIKKRKKLFREENIISLMAGKGIPPKFLNIKTDKDISQFLTSGKGLYLWGPAGTGKTVMACSIARELILNGEDDIKFISSPKFIIQLQSSYRREDDPIDKILESVTCHKVLIIDDMGAEKLTDF